MAKKKKGIAERWTKATKKEIEKKIKSLPVAFLEHVPPIGIGRPEPGTRSLSKDSPPTFIEFQNGAIIGTSYPEILKKTLTRKNKKS